MHKQRVLQSCRVNKLWLWLIANRQPTHNVCLVKDSLGMLWCPRVVACVVIVQLLYPMLIVTEEGCCCLFHQQNSRWEGSFLQILGYLSYCGGDFLLDMSYLTVYNYLLCHLWIWMHLWIAADDSGIRCLNIFKLVMCDIKWITSVEWLAVEVCQCQEIAVDAHSHSNSWWALVKCGRF